MIRIKKIVLIVLLATTFLGLLLGCSQNTTKQASLKYWMHDSSELRVLCTTAQVGDIVSNIGGEKIKVSILIQGDLDPHSYELVKGDDEKIIHADLVFYNGLNLEHGASLSTSLQSRTKALSIGEQIKERFPEKILKKGEIVDPHLWMDISVWQLGIEPITEQLCRQDPENAPYYKERALLLSERMGNAHLALKEKMGQIPEKKRYLLTSHDAFRYFARGYLSQETETEWQQRFAAPEGLAPDGQLSSIDIQKMIDFLKVHRVSVLFPESNVSRDSIQKIADAGRELNLDVKVCLETLYGDSMSNLSYLEMMEKNGDIIARHLHE